MDCEDCDCTCIEANQITSEAYVITDEALISADDAQLMLDQGQLSNDQATLDSWNFEYYSCGCDGMMSPKPTVQSRRLQVSDEMRRQMSDELHAAHRKLRRRWREKWVQQIVDAHKASLPTSN